ncbi:cyclin-like protein [Limtongia smithiae]|uniref:cyclin-like protein n=1 Tax=Limtongia smithiae TaxID=1125753 RepID=UPI0034CE139E
MDRRSRQTFRVHADENAVIPRQASRAVVKQPIGLSDSATVANAAGGITALTNDKVGLKAGARRVVLGDVSNALKSVPSGNAPGGKLVQPLKKNITLTVVPSREIEDATTQHSQEHSETVDAQARLSKQKIYSDNDTSAVPTSSSSMRMSDDFLDSPELPAVIDEDDDITMEDRFTSPRDAYGNTTTTVLHGFDSTDYTNVRSTTNPDALFPIVNDETRRAYAAVAAQFVQTEEIRAKAADYEGDDDWFDVSMVSEYSEEIFAYMRELELQFRPNPGYMDNQTEIHWSMRSILVDWLVEVHSRLGLLPETLYLTINYIDRFLSLKVVSLAKLQLVGATALFVAAKFEEINCPSVKEIRFMVDNTYTVDEIFKAERFMIGLLEFNLGWPGPMSFLRRTSKADDYDLDTRTLAKYIIEITIMDERFVGALPSWIAAASHCLSRKILNRGEWTIAHTYYSGYTSVQLRPAMNVLVECLRNPGKHHRAIFEKYSDRKYKKAALYVQEWIKTVSA